WNVDDAVGLLGEASFHKLTAQDVERFNLDPPSRAGRSAYLVRAVSNVRTRREFTVLTDGNAVVIQHNSFARRTTLQRDAVVVFLDKDPSDVFVEANVAEKPDISRAEH